MKPSCSVDGCDRPHHAKSYCRIHHQRVRRTGTIADRLPRLCSIEGCGQKHSARGWCQLHYNRWSHFGDPLHVPPVKAPGCSVDGCGRPKSANGMCYRHYSRVKRTGDTGPAGTIYRYGAVCDVEGCEQVHQARGWCAFHYRRWKAYGDPLREKAPGWNMKPGAPIEVRPAPRKLGPRTTWRQVHNHLARRRGRASDRSCVRCGDQAKHWAYDNADPDVRFDEEKGMAFSLDLDHYLPMCASCHRQFDVDHQRALLAFLVGRVLQLEAMVLTARGTA